MLDTSFVLLGWVLALGVGAGLVWALRTLRRERRATGDVVRAARRIANGDVHIVAAGGPGAPGELAAAINALGEQVRRARLDAHPERALDRAMLRATPNALMIVDVRGIIRAVSPSARSQLPWRGEPVGAEVAEAAPTLPELERVLSEVSQSRAVTERAVRHGGRDLLIRGLPLPDGGGTLGVVLDVTSMVAAERVRREFVSNVSHELRTPITAIVGYAETLKEEAVPEEARPQLDALVRNAMRLSRLCDDVLALSQLEARTVDLPLEVEAVMPLVKEVIDRLRERAIARGIALTATGDPEIHATVNVDAFLAAVSNLCDNAVKYTQRGGEVTVLVSREGADVRVEVRDNGPGIDAVHHPRLFERFYRVDADRSRNAGGTGLGLALVKHYCKAMHAQVSVWSAPGQGSRFTLLVPAAEPVAVEG